MHTKSAKIRIDGRENALKKSQTHFFHIIRALMTVLEPGQKSFLPGIFLAGPGPGPGPGPTQPGPGPAQPGYRARARARFPAQGPPISEVLERSGPQTPQTRNRCSEPLQASQVALERSLERSELNLFTTTSVVQCRHDSGSEQPRQGVKSTKNADFCGNFVFFFWCL